MGGTVASGLLGSYLRARLRVLVLLPLLPVIMSEDRQEFCQNEQFTAQCGANEIILMTLAQYGRMALSRCVKKDYGYIGCGTDVLDIAHAFCSGRRSCEIPIPNLVLDSLDPPCPEDFKSYLKATYDCQKVVRADSHRCSSSSFVELTESTGLIASVASQETICGSYKAPWLLRAPPGQTIYITLLDYSVVPLDVTASAPSGAMCVAYASIREKGGARPVTLCGGREQEKIVYRSTTNVVEIIVQGAGKQRFFLLKYQFIGCADLSAPSHGWLRRDGDSVEVGCDNTPERWHLSCNEGTWVGVVGNCTAGPDETGWGGLALPISLSVGIVILIALTIAGCILLAGLVCVQRHRRSIIRRRQTAELDHEHIVANEENYRKAFYAGFPPKPEDPRIPRHIGPNGENEYASIQDNMSPGHSQTSGSDDMSRASGRTVPFTYYEPPQCLPHPQFGTQAKRKCSGTVNVVPDHNGELREYFVLDTDTTMGRNKKTAQFGQGPGRPTGPSGSMGDR